MLKKLINEAEFEKIACYTRCTRHIVELVPLEHDERSDNRLSCATRITIYYFTHLLNLSNLYNVSLHP
jgi:hypothetical protein